MTIPIGGIAVPKFPVPGGLSGAEGLAAAGVGRPSEAAGASIVLDGTTDNGLVACSASDMAVLVEMLQCECSKVSAANEKATARASETMKKEQIEKKLAQIAEAIKKETEAEQWGIWGDVLKWVGVAVSAALGAVGSVFSAGGTAVVASIIITAILTADTVANAVSDELLKRGLIDEKDAHIIGACFGNLQDIVGACLDEENMGADSKWALMALGLVDSIAKAVLSIVFSGGSNVGKIADAVAKLVAIGVDAVVEAQTIITETIAEGQRKALLTDDQLLYLQLCSMFLQVISMVVGATTGGSGTSRGVDSPLKKALAPVRLAGKLVDAGAKAGTGIAEFGGAMAEADASEAKSRSERHEALNDAANEMLKRAISQLRGIFDDLMATHDSAESMLEAEYQQARMAFGGARV